MALHGHDELGKIGIKGKKNKKMQFASEYTPPPPEIFNTATGEFRPQNTLERGRNKPKGAGTLGVLNQQPTAGDFSLTPQSALMSPAPAPAPAAPQSRPSGKAEHVVYDFSKDSANPARELLTSAELDKLYDPDVLARDKAARMGGYVSEERLFPKSLATAKQKGTDLAPEQMGAGLPLEKRYTEEAPPPDLLTASNAPAPVTDALIDSTIKGIETAANGTEKATPIITSDLDLGTRAGREAKIEEIRQRYTSVQGYKRSEGERAKLLEMTGTNTNGMSDEKVVRKLNKYLRSDDGAGIKDPFIIAGVMKQFENNPSLLADGNIKQTIGKAQSMAMRDKFLEENQNVNEAMLAITSGDPDARKSYGKKTIQTASLIIQALREGTITSENIGTFVTTRAGTNTTLNTTKMALAVQDSIAKKATMKLASSLGSEEATRIYKETTSGFRNKSLKERTKQNRLDRDRQNNLDAYSTEWYDLRNQKLRQEIEAGVDLRAIASSLATHDEANPNTPIASLTRRLAGLLALDEQKNGVGSNRVHQDIRKLSEQIFAISPEAVRMAHDIARLENMYY